MTNLLMVLVMLADAEDHTFDELKSIGDKIIPSDPWAFAIQLTATAILVFAIAKILVKPAKKFIAARNEYIETNLNEAATKNKEADEKLAQANKEIKEAQLKSKEIVDNAKVTALNEKDRIVNETNVEINNMKKKAKEDIEMERTKMKEELSSEVIEVALMAAGKVVNREITSEDNKKIVSDFIKEDNK